LVFSQQTAAYYGWHDAGSRVDDPALGFYQALAEARIPFEMVHDRMMGATELGRFRVSAKKDIAGRHATDPLDCSAQSCLVAFGITSRRWPMWPGLPERQITAQDHAARCTKDFRRQRHQQR
jgi:hypothetical protein